jgi:hypothetical protein
MNINRHNYEEYFILYLDNELSSTERRMVEAFVQNNPDLKDELDVLLQSKLTPDNNIVFDNKEELLKIADGSAINLTNYEEWLTLYIDNEVNTEHRKQVEVFFASHPQIQKELSILQKTKLQPEEIVFPYKESLYRKTEKVRVIQLNWRRIAVAAILLLVLSTTVILIINNRKQPGTIAKGSTTNGVKSKTENAIVTNPTKNETTEPKNETIEIENNNPNNSNKVGEPKLASNHERIKNKSSENKNDKKAEQAIANNSNDDKPSNYLPQEPVNNVQRKNYGIVSNIESNSSPANKVIDVTKPLAVPSDKGLTFAKNPENNSSDLEEGGNKSSRGFFRKAVRFIEKRTGIKPANDDNKVLIGSLAVKL